MNGFGAPHRWDLWLTAAGVAAAILLVSLAAAADSAFEDRHALAIEGHLLGLAHELEVKLRQTGPSVARQTLEMALAEEETSGLVTGLWLEGSAGIEVGVGASSSGDAAFHTRPVELFLGRRWHPSGEKPTGGEHPGARHLLVVTDPAVAAQPSIERMLLPATTVTGVVMVALALLGGRLLMRREREERSRVERRRLEAMARAGAGLAHQLRTPLATIKGSCQLVLEGSAAPSGRRFDVVLEQIQHMDRLLGQLLDYARPPDPEPTAVVLRDAASEAAAIDPRVTVAVPADLIARVDPEHLMEILENLVENALEAAPQGAVEIGGKGQGPRRVMLTVGDRGPGPGDDPEVLFEPYVTHSADGTGLGLPIARALAEVNDGELELTRRPGGGTLAILTLPRPGAMP